MLKDRLPILKAIIIAWGMLYLCAPARLQAGITTQSDTIRVMDYNLLDYPGTDYTTRDPYFRKVVHTAKPDILVVEEMTSQIGVNTFLSDVLNYYQSGLYSTIPFHDGPDTDPHVYYKSSKATFLNASYFLMEDGLRYVAVYMLKGNATGDTLRLYAVHLKASTGYETQRGAECTQLRDTLNNLSPGTKFMVMGDFNFYNSSTEPGFTKLTESETNNNGRLKDPINQVGNWHDNAAFAPYHTQSPRTRQFGGGSNGGMDDRFDFILTSYSSLDDNTIVSSYKAYGNDGNHLNDSINHLPNTAVPDSVANGLHYASDHLPVICDFQFASAVTLGPFTQLVPSNGATAQAVSGILRWQSSASATGYDVYLGTTNPPTSVVSTNQADTSYNYSGLGNNTVYYWKAIAKNSSGSLAATGSPWSFTTVQVPPVSFNLTSPANGASGQAISGTLSWQTSTNATGYDVYLSTSSPPTTKVSSNQSGTTYSYSTLQNNTIYYWKVVAKNAVDSVAATGSPWSFTTIIAAPGAFTLTSPSNGASNQSVSGTLSWQTSTNATAYDVYLDTNSSPVTVVSSNQTGTSYAYGGLSNNTKYRWKVVAKNAGGNTVASGTPWSFTTIVAAPGAFTLTSPSNGAGSQSVSGTLSWQTSTNATGYDVYLDTNSSPVTVVSSNQVGSSYAYSGLSNSTTYRWKVVAKNAAGSTLASGTPWSFTTIVAAPSTFNLLSPSNGANNQSISGTISWQSSGNASVYDVYAGTDNPPATIVSSNQVGTSYEYSGLQHNSIYYWNVVAKNAGGNTPATGAPWSFTTIVAAPGAFDLLSPLDGVGEQRMSGTLSWQVSANAGTYDVYLDTINPPMVIASLNQSGTLYSYSGLSKGKTYYWKVIAQNIGGNTVATSAPWNFVTAAGDPPGEFVLLSPSNGARGLLLSETLSWAAADSAASYDVYVDTLNPPTTLVASSISTTSHVQASMEPGTTYYWKVVAKNVHGTTTASNAVASFSTAYLPATPSGFSSTNVTTISIELSWVDNANNEDGYRILRSTFADSAFVQVGHDLPANTISFVDTGLNINQRYYYRVVPFNNLGEGNPANFNIATLASTPAIAGLVSGSYSTIRVTINAGINPASTEYAIQAVVGSTTEYAQANGSTGAMAVWLTYAAWGATMGMEVHGLHSCAEYTFRVQARNADHVETALSDGARETTQCFSVTSSTSRGWNLVSIPVTVMDGRSSALFPNSLSSAFSYQGRYVIVDSMQNGSGYWLKFRGDSTTRLAGDPRSADTFYLRRGWNIIGSISSAISVSNIEEDSTGTVTSPYYAYSGSYIIADSILPMTGCWVKAGAAGKLFLTVATRQAKSHGTSPLLPPGMNSLALKDHAGHQQTLYFGVGQCDEVSLSKFELPPLPPVDAFDVRFASQRVVELLPANVSLHSEFPIEMQAVTYPLTLSWRLNSADHDGYELSVGSQSKALTANGQMTITGSSSVSLNADFSRDPLPKEIALEQNYPNPFNPQTIISYQLPTDSYVTLKVYTVLGQEVATLVSGIQKAGYKSVSFDGNNLPSGVYFCRMTAGNFSAMKKMLLLK